MQTVSSFMSRRSSPLTDGVADGATGGGSGPVKTGGPSSGDLSAMRAGTSAISALSNFAMGFRKAAGLDQQARDEGMNAKQEYISALEKSSAIHRELNGAIQSQVAQASANGLDIASGSVQAVGQQAEDDSDRVLTQIRNTADTNAALRRGRAAALRSAAKSQRITAGIGLVTDIGNTVASAFGGG